MEKISLNMGEIVRFSMWRDLSEEKFIVIIAAHNKRIGKPKQYPFACRVGRSFLGKLTESIFEDLKKDYLVIFS